MLTLSTLQCSLTIKDVIYELEWIEQLTTDSDGRKTLKASPQRRGRGLVMPVNATAPVTASFIVRRVSSAMIIELQNAFDKDEWIDVSITDSTGGPDYVNMNYAILAKSPKLVGFTDSDDSGSTNLDFECQPRDFDSLLSSDVG